MKTFTCYYFTRFSVDLYDTEIIAESRDDARIEFEETHPSASLVSMKEKLPSRFHGVDKYGNKGIFEDFEQSIGE